MNGKVARPVPGDVLTFVPRYTELSRLPPAQLREYLAEGRLARIVRDAPVVCLHGKTLVVDGRVTLIGSHNFDPRSSNLNSECGLVITDDVFAALVEQHIRWDIEPQNSWVVARRNERETLASRFSRALGAVSMALPVFDLWPYTYSSVFALREGAAPVPPGHLDFYRHYRDIGQFPEVKDAATRMKLRFFKSFTGWARPLL